MTVDEKMALNAFQLESYREDLITRLGIISLNIIYALDVAKVKHEHELIWDNLSKLEEKIAPKKTEWSDLFIDMAIDLVLGKFVTLITSSSKAFRAYLAKKKEGLIEELGKPDVNEELANYLIGKSENKPYSDFESDIKDLTGIDDGHDFGEEFLGEVLDKSFKKAKTDMQTSLKDPDSNVSKAVKAQLDNLDKYLESIEIIIQEFFKKLMKIVEETDSLFWLAIMSIPINLLFKNPASVKQEYADKFYRIIRDYVEGVLFVGMIVEEGTLWMNYWGTRIHFSNQPYHTGGDYEGLIPRRAKPINKHKLVRDVVAGLFEIFLEKEYDQGLSYLYTALPPGNWSDIQDFRTTRLARSKASYSIEFDALRFNAFGNTKTALFLRLRYKFDKELALPCGEYCYKHVFLRWISPQISELALEKSKQIFVIDTETKFLHDVYALNVIGTRQFVPETYLPSKP